MDKLKLKKSELVNILIDAIECFPPFDGTITLALTNGTVASFMRSLSGHSESSEGQELQNQYAKFKKIEVIKRLTTSIEQIEAWGKMTITFETGVLVDIAWSSTFNLLIKPIKK